MSKLRLGQWLVPVLAAAGIAAMVFTVAAGDKHYPVAAPLAEPAKAPFAETVSGAGLVEASTQNISVATPLAGVVSQVYVKAGDRVPAGAPLFGLDQRPLAAELDARSAAVRVAEARVAESEAQLAEADDQLAKVRELSDPRAVSREEIVRRETAARAAASRVRLAQATLAQARARARQTQVDLDRLTVRAPVGGDVLQLNVRLGEYVAPSGSQPPVVLGDTRTLHVRVDIDEADVWRFRPGARAVAYLRGNSSIAVPASYVRAEPYVVPKKSLTGASAERVDTRVLQVIFAFEPGTQPIYVGQQMDVYIEARERAAGAGGKAAKS
ncbi:MAG TPA: efflux RND transporter periplasmic adaptor subunit [Burkholderiales bacterium]|nr:efflux RND transporter periplasmic adaptor subunit [Burkholderiales bacterium]